MELNIVGTNAITYPAMHVWDWRVAIYLFLGGLSGGLMTMSAINYLRTKKQSLDSTCSWQIPLLAPILLAIGLIFLNLDLARPLNAFWFYLAFKPVSPMSWGAWIVFVIYPLMILYALASLPKEVKAKLKTNSFIRNTADTLQPYLFPLAKANVIAGILLAIYTGILLSTLVARPLWNSAILPILFLISGMSAGAAVMIIMAKTKEVKLFFTKIDIWLIIAEVVVLLLFFYGHYTGDAAHRQAIMPFFSRSHEFFPYFLSIVVLGVCLPLAIVLKFLEVTGEHTEELTTSGLLLMNASAVLVLIGGAVIRFAIVYAGQLSGYGGYM